MQIAISIFFTRNKLNYCWPIFFSNFIIIINNGYFIKTDDTFYEKEI